MQAKKAVELEIARRFLRLADLGATEPEASERPDVLTTIDGRRIGIEVTEVHGDERLGVKGSAVRAEEAHRTPKGQGVGPVMSITTNFHPAISARIADKVKSAQAYPSSHGCDELWLLLAAQVPQQPGILATFIDELFLDMDLLDGVPAKLLRRSPFNRAYLYLMMQRRLFEWRRGEGWKGTALA